MARCTTGRSASTVSDALFNRTGGNPFFLEEILVAAGDDDPDRSLRPTAPVVAGRARAAQPRRPVERRSPRRGGRRGARPPCTVRRAGHHDRLHGRPADRPPAAPGGAGPAAGGRRRRVQLPPRPGPRRRRGSAPGAGAPAPPRHGPRARCQEPAAPTSPSWPATPPARGSTTSWSRWPARGWCTTSTAARRTRRCVLALEALPEAPDDVVLLEAAARAAWLAGQYDEAMPHAERWIALDADGGSTRSRSRPRRGLLARLYHEIGDRRGALGAGGRDRGADGTASRGRGSSQEPGLAGPDLHAERASRGGDPLGRPGHRGGRRRRRQARAGPGHRGARFGHGRPAEPLRRRRDGPAAGHRRGRGRRRLAARLPRAEQHGEVPPRRGAGERRARLARMREAAELRRAST